MVTDHCFRCGAPGDYEAAPGVVRCCDWCWLCTVTPVIRRANRQWSDRCEQFTEQYRERVEVALAFIPRKDEPCPTT